MGNSVKNSRMTMFPARHSSLPDLVAFLEGFCDATGIDRSKCLRLNLVLEELLTNTVSHGHRGDSDAPVWVTLAADNDTVRIAYEDVAPPFNPYARISEVAPDTPIESRRVGGLGVFLTKELAATYDYAYVFGRNRIDLAFAR